jgi:hypothetical protein
VASGTGGDRRWGGLRNGNRPKQVQTAEGKLEIPAPQIRDRSSLAVCSRRHGAEGEVA